MAQEIVDHIEKYLGTIQRGWGPDALEHKRFQIIECRSQADPSVTAYATLGLHRHALPSWKNPTKLIRHELFVLTPTSTGKQHFPEIVEQVAAETLDRQRPYLRGEVIGPRGRLADGFPMEALYVSLPAVFSQEFAACSVEGNDVAIAMLIPITGQEAAFIGKSGWSAFEDKLVETGVDVVDLSRRCVCSHEG
ncbi:MAG: suppressor of fused domain protein [Phycisphaerales bacterium]